MENFYILLEFQNSFMDAVHLVLYMNIADGEAVNEIGELWVI
jgi:hypothetical protein